MSSDTQTSAALEQPDGRLSPYLEAGDRLSRAEFERRYEAMSHLRKAELIEGVVFMPSPVRLSRHGLPSAQLVTWLTVYMAGTSGVMVGDNCTVRLDLDNEPQPDALLFIESDCGGQATVSEDDYLEEAPEFVAEVSSSSASFDLHTKFHVYRRNGVREYLVWRVLDRQIDWFVLREGQYERRPLDGDGLLRSEVFPGLWLAPASLTSGDMATVLATLQRGLASPEHADFVAKLHAHRTAG